MTGREESSQKTYFDLENRVATEPWIKRYIMYLKPEFSAVSAKQYVLSAIRLINILKTQYPELDDLSIIKRINSTDLRFYLAEVSKNKDGTQKSFALQHQQSMHMKKFLKYCASENLIVSDVSSIEIPVTRRKDTIKEKDTITSEDLNKYLKELENKTRHKGRRLNASQIYEKFKNILLIDLFSCYGFRTQAVLNLNIDDFDFEKLEFSITDKGNRSSTIIMDETTTKRLSNYLVIRNQIIKHQQKTNPSFNTNALFVTRKGKRLNHNSVATLAKNIGLEFGKVFTPHRFRASYATNLYNATKDLLFVQRAMNHSSPTTTERYISSKGDIKAKALDILRKEV